MKRFRGLENYQTLSLVDVCLKSLPESVPGFQILPLIKKDFSFLWLIIIQAIPERMTSPIPSKISTVGLVINVDHVHRDKDMISELMSIQSLKLWEILPFCLTLIFDI